MRTVEANVQYVIVGTNTNEFLTDCCLFVAGMQLLHREICCQGGSGECSSWLTPQSAFTSITPSLRPTTLGLASGIESVPYNIHDMTFLPVIWAIQRRRCGCILHWWWAPELALALSTFTQLTASTAGVAFLLRLGLV